MRYSYLVKIAKELDSKKLYAVSDTITKKLYRISLVDEKKINDYIEKAYDMLIKQNLTKSDVIDKISELVDKDFKTDIENKKFILDNINEDLKGRIWWVHSKAGDLLDQDIEDEMSEPEAIDEESSSPIVPTGKPKEFLEKLSGPAQAASERVDGVIPASIILAMAAWESGWGKSKLASEHGNFFGIKSSPTSGGKGSVEMSTFEFNGGKHQEQAQFATFNSDAIAAMSAFPQFLMNNRRYRSAIDAGKAYSNNKSTSNLFKIVDAIFDAGYSTDPGEPSNIKKLIRDYNLTKYD